MEIIIGLKIIPRGGGAVAEWSKALHLCEKINVNQKDPRFAPRPGHLFKIIPRGGCLLYFIQMPSLCHLEPGFEPMTGGENRLNHLSVSTMGLVDEGQLFFD